MLAACRKQGYSLACAESCTGGRVAAALTSIPGSSEIFVGGIICYANEVKCALLGVPASMLAQYGAVSEEVACAMARGALTNLGVHLALSVTGIAGPGGATEGKEAGLVYHGIARHDGVMSCKRCVFSGTREEIRTQAVRASLKLGLRHANP